MGSSKAPKTPDYTGAAREQAKSDKEIAQYLTQANRVTQIDPYGQTTWTQSANPDTAALQAQLNDLFAQGAQDVTRKGYNQAAATAAAKRQKELEAQIAQSGGATRWTQTTTLSPEQQKLLEQQQSLQGMQNSRIQELIQSMQSPTLGAQRDLPQRELAAQRTIQDRTLKEADQNNIQSLLYGQITKQYGDRFARDEAAQRASLANQGFQMGSEGFQSTLNDFTRQKNSAYEDAAVQAALASYDQMNQERALNQSEYSTLTGADLSKFGALSADDLNRFSAQTTDDLNRFNALSGDDLNRYNTQMGYLSQLLGGVQGPTTPQYQPYAQATQYQGADLVGALSGQYQGNLNRSNAQNAGRGQTIDAIGGLGGLGITAAVAF